MAKIRCNKNEDFDTAEVKINQAFSVTYTIGRKKGLLLEVAMFRSSGNEILREGSAQCEGELSIKSIADSLMYASEKALAYYLNGETLDPKRDGGAQTATLAEVVKYVAPYLSDRDDFESAAARIKMAVEKG